ncbi:helix-turn-helix domain-containing protein [Streptomyces mirabilis]|uniref:helix-turn-helix domain-containing protein n=1 Tax=Streptomyces mirabilis TaxID=68239 RepID=UPI0036D997D8
MSNQKGEPQMQPTPPPEADTISTALRRSSISQREASRRAGINESYWRRVIAGHNRGVPVNASLITVARMAHAVGITPDELAASGGRPEVVEELRALAGAEEADLGKPFRIIAVALEEYTLDEQEEILQRYLESQRRDGTEGGNQPEAV